MEYVTYVILLIYLGGVVIFFLFLTTYLSNESKLNSGFAKFSLNHALSLIFYLKLLICVFLLNEDVLGATFLINSHSSLALINNYVFLTDFFSANGDIWYVAPLFCVELAAVLILLGFILLYAMIGVIVILKQKNEIYT